MSRRTNPRRGSTAIEFALWLPVLLIFVSAVVDWGDHMNKRVRVSRSVMEGCRSGSAVYESPMTVPGSRIKQRAADRTERVLTDLGITCPNGDCILSVTWCPDNPAVCGTPPFDALKVSVSYDIEPWFGLVPTPDRINESFLMAAEHQH